MIKVDEEDLGPSKSELKRQMTQRQKLAEVLSEISGEALNSIPIEDRLRAEIAETKKIKTFGAIKRHKQHLGKLMRFLDETEISAIQLRLDAIQGLSRAETAKMHRFEAMRDKLIADDSALTKLIELYPALEIQTMRNLIRSARKEKELKKPPKSYREIFRLLKESSEAEPQNT